MRKDGVVIGLLPVTGWRLGHIDMAEEDGKELTNDEPVIGFLVVRVGNDIYLNPLTATFEYEPDANSTDYVLIRPDGKYDMPKGGVYDNLEDLVYQLKQIKLSWEKEK